MDKNEHYWLPLNEFVKFTTKIDSQEEYILPLNYLWSAFFGNKGSQFVKFEFEFQHDSLIIKLSLDKLKLKYSNLNEETIREMFQDWSFNDEIIENFNLEEDIARGLTKSILNNVPTKLKTEDVLKDYLIIKDININNILTPDLALIRDLPLKKWNFEIEGLFNDKKVFYHNEVPLVLIPFDKILDEFNKLKATKFVKFNLETFKEFLITKLAINEESIKLNNLSKDEVENLFEGWTFNPIITGKDKPQSGKIKSILLNSPLGGINHFDEIETDI